MKKEKVAEIVRFLFLFVLSESFLFLISTHLSDLKKAFNEFYYDSLTVSTKREDFSPRYILIDSDSSQFDSIYDKEKAYKNLFKKLKSQGAHFVYFALASPFYEQEAVYLKEELDTLGKGFPYGFITSNPMSIGVLKDSGKPVVDGRTNRIFRREVVRSFPFLNEEAGTSFFESLSMGLKQQKHNLQGKKKELFEESLRNQLKDRSLVLNYKNMSSLTKLSLGDLRSILKFNFREKVVFVGSTEFFQTSLNYGEGSFFNTPWNGDESPTHLGVSLLYLYANYVANLEENSHIRWGQNSNHFFFHLLLFFFSFYSWFLSKRYYGFLYSFFQISYLFFLSVYLFKAHLVFLDGFVLCGISFFGSFLGSFSAERKEIKRKSEFRRSLEQENKNTSRDNQLFERVLKDVDCFVDESRMRLESYLLEEDSKIQVQMKGLIRDRSRLVFSHVKGLYHYVQALEKKGVSPRNFFLRPLVFDILKSFEEKIIEKNITLEIDVSDKDTLFTDQILFQAILYNIVFNAVKYTFSETLIRISYEDLPSGKRIRVCDQGPGFSSKGGAVKNFIPKLNEESQKQFSSKGYGLGLFLSQVIAEKIDLDFFVTSDDDFRSIFTLSFKKI